jgi:hypothetical protein
MIKILAFLWSGCWHDWRPTGKTVRVLDAWDDVIAYKIEYQCQKCNRIRAWTR